MTIPIKVECGCGQRYAFDAEPVNGRVASAVACPACGADGTAAANEVISQTIQQPVVAANPALGLRRKSAAVSTESGESAPEPPRRGPMPGQGDPGRAEAEARSKIYWGDPPEDVVRFLMSQSFSFEDATELVKVLTQHRTIALRKIGIWKIIYGILLMFVPVVTFIVMMASHLIIPRLLVIAVGLGLWGVWMLIKGLIMVFVPKLETGDIADQ